MVQQQRRVFRVQQGLGIAQVAQAHDGALNLVAQRCKPLGGGLPQGFPTCGISRNALACAAGTQSCSAASVC